MLPKGSIGKILQYYSSSQRFEPEIERALIDFFNLNGPEEIENIGWNETAEGLFNEWFVYDFRLNSGLTVLQDYCERNPYKLKEYELTLYRDLLATNHFGLFEVKEVWLNQGLKLYDFETKKNYDIQERAATHELKPGYLFHNRIAKINGHWEMVGTNSPVWPVHLGKNIRQVLNKNNKKNLTPKDVNQEINGQKNKKPMEVEIDPTQALIRLQNSFESTGLNKFISAQTVSNWVLEKDSLINPTEIISLVFGLTDNKVEPAVANDLISALQDVYNTTPQKALGDKSPQEKFNENPEHQPEFNTEITRLGGEKWLKRLKKAHDYMNKHDYYKSARAFENTFTALLEEKTTKPDIYRIYANKAVAHFACSEEGLGEKMIELALLLNPNYDFAQKLKKKYENGDYDSPIGLARRQALGQKKIKGDKVSSKNLFHIPKRVIENDPAVKYYKYIKQLNINFATEQLTTSKLTTFDQTKIGCNEPCPCGSGKKFKKCCEK